METFKLQEPHAVTEKGKEFLASLGEKDRALQTMMSKSLGSSYFVERTHAFRKWAASALAAGTSETAKANATPKQ